MASPKEQKALKPLLLGHRGARATRSIPENTIASFDLAIKHGCHGFEFDVRLTKDGHAVICHDPKFKGKVIARSSGMDLAELPTLEDVLLRYAKTKFLDIELKVAGLEEHTLTGLHKYPPRNGYVISSFLPEVIRKLATLNPQVQLGIICENRSQLSKWRDLPVQSVIVEKKLAQEKLIDEIHALGRKIFVWTINRQKDMERFAEYGVDGIISDETELLVHTFSPSK